MPISESQLVIALEQSQPAIGAMCIRRLQTIQARFDVDDLQQVVALKAIRNRESLQTDDPAIAGHWIRTIARNACMTAINHELTLSRNVVKTLPINDLPVLGIDELEFAEDLEQVEAALKRIPARQAQAVRFRYFEMLDNPSIAQRMGISPSAVGNLVSRGLAAVRRLVG